MQRGFEILPLDLTNKNLEITFYEVREGESTNLSDTEQKEYPCGIRYPGHYGSPHILVGFGIQDIMNKHKQYLLPFSPPENKFAVFNSEVRNSTEYTVYPKSVQILF